MSKLGQMYAVKIPHLASWAYYFISYTSTASGRCTHCDFNHLIYAYKIPFNEYIVLPLDLKR